MHFKEFVNRNKNAVQFGTAKRIASTIEITEERDAFYNGELFKKYDMVESDGKLYRILEQCSNYYQVVDQAGNVLRKFAKQLTKSTPAEVLMTESLFHGYQLQTETAKALLKDHAQLIAAGDFDDVGLLKTLKEADTKMDNTQYHSKDKLTVAKIIADAVGVPYDVVSSPDNLVNAAIRKAKKDPVLMKNKALLVNMLQIAKEVGIKFTDNSFEVSEATVDRSPMFKDAVNKDKILSLKNLIAIAKEKGDKSKAQTLELELKKLQEETIHVGYRNSKGDWIKTSTHNNYTDAKKASEELEKSGKKGVQHRYDNGNSIDPGMRKLAHESVEPIEELSSNTLKTYSQLAKANANKLIGSATKTKSIDKAHAKLDKAGKRLDSAVKADKKVFKKEWERKVGITKESMTFAELRSQLAEASPEAAEKHAQLKDVPEAEVSAKAHELPHGHTLSPSSETHRHQLINKLKG